GRWRLACRHPPAARAEPRSPAREAGEQRAWLARAARVWPRPPDSCWGAEPGWGPRTAPRGRGSRPEPPRRGGGGRGGGGRGVGGGGGWGRTGGATSPPTPPTATGASRRMPVPRPVPASRLTTAAD